jgi:hypothetical protein
MERRSIFPLFWVSLFSAGLDRADAAFWEAENLSVLFESTTVKQAQFDPNARDDIAYPEWLEGTWKCQSEMTGFQAPLGNRFLGYFVRETTFLGYF